MPYYGRRSYQSYSNRSYSRSSSPSASVIEANGMLVLTSSYNADLVSWIKGLPQADRVYQQTDKTWTIDPKHSNLARERSQNFLEEC